ncbi:MAG: hypothetical protein GY801_07500 [bacterium]|nr:hypothetical protein [bacterium]
MADTIMTVDALHCQGDTVKAASAHSVVTDWLREMSCCHRATVVRVSSTKPARQALC